MPWLQLLVVTLCAAIGAQGIIELATCVLDVLTEAKDMFSASFVDALGPQHMSQSFVEATAKPLYARLKQDLEHFLANYKPAPRGVGVPKVFEVFEVMRSLHELIHDEPVAAKAVPWVPQSSLCVHAAAIMRGHNHLDNVSPLAVRGRGCHFFRVDVGRAFFLHIPCLIEGLRAQAIGVYMPRLQKQEELVPISDKLRHTDAVQALFIMLVAFLHTFQVRTVTWQQPFRPARREGSCACALSHTAVLPGRVFATRGDVRTSGRHGAVCSVRHLPVQYVFRAAMRLLCGWANAVPFADQILATLQQNQKGNAVHALASTEVNTPYVVAWRLVVL